MAYRLSFGDDVSDGVRRCAHEQLAGAVEKLERAGDDPVEAVHDARKHLKKARALLRLVRPALGRKAYGRENAALREAGLALSGTRDADVLVQTAAGLAEQAAGRLPADVFEQLRAALAEETAAGRDGGGPDLTAVIEALRAAEQRIETWSLDDAEWDDVLAGVTRAYERGQEALAQTRAKPTPERLHAWRKRAKDLWYHQRLLAPAWPDVLGAHAEAAHELTELLGHNHDLAVLAERLKDTDRPLPLAPEAARAELLTLVAHCSTELRAAAWQLGDRIYTESPKAFARRLTRIVHAAVTEQDDAGTA